MFKHNRSTSAFIANMHTIAEVTPRQLAEAHLETAHIGRVGYGVELGSLSQDAMSLHRAFTVGPSDGIVPDPSIVVRDALHRTLHGLGRIYPSGNRPLPSFWRDRWYETKLATTVRDIAGLVVYASVLYPNEEPIIDPSTYTITAPTRTLDEQLSFIGEHADRIVSVLSESSKVRIPHIEHEIRRISSVARQSSSQRVA